MLRFTVFKVCCIHDLSLIPESFLNFAGLLVMFLNMAEYIAPLILSSCVESFVTPTF